LDWRQASKPMTSAVLGPLPFADLQFRLEQATHAICADSRDRFYSAAMCSYSTTRFSSVALYNLQDRETVLVFLKAVVAFMAAMQSQCTLIGCLR